MTIAFLTCNLSSSPKQKISKFKQNPAFPETTDMPVDGQKPSFRLCWTQDTQRTEKHLFLSKGSIMDLSQITGTSMANSGVQGVGGHQHRHKSISDQVKDLESAISDAQKSGKLTSDQATAMTKELDDIKKMLSQVGTSSQAGATAQLSADDRHKIRKELHDVGKQLFEALNPQAAASSTTSGSQMEAIFKMLDANGDGNIDKNEFSSFINNLAQNGAGKSDQMSQVSSYSRQATISIAEMQSTFSVTA
jgi:hypothetical protein